MPEHPNPKPRPHPFATIRGSHAATIRATAPHGFVELITTSNYTFLTGGSHPEELVAQAAAHGSPAIGIADTNTLAGVVRAHCAAKDAGVRCIVGSRLVLPDAPESHIAVFPTDRASYGRLCRLLTVGKRRSEKGECTLTMDDLGLYAAGLLGIMIPPRHLDDLRASTLGALRDIFANDRLSLAAHMAYSGDDAGRLASLARAAQAHGVPLVATNDVLYHTPQRRPLQDVLTCIRLGTTLPEAGYALAPNAERHLKPPEEMARLFAAFPNALLRSVEVARRTEGFSLDLLRYEYADEVCPPGLTPIEYLRQLTHAGARERYPRGVPEKVARAIDHELAIIDELAYAPYFLTVHDLVVFARARGIICQGRGAAANSAVCFCLGVTSVDPDRINLLFERFVSRERNEPPDIDIDFEHERREEVIQYIYAKYGRERAALTAEVISYRGRSAVREVGKAVGLSLDCVDKLAKTLGWWDGVAMPAEHLRALGLNPEDRTIRLTLALASQIQGFPRHLSQHVGGFVITRGPLCESVPIENAAMPDRTIIEWDKDDIDAMGMLKVDCLGLGMLTCIRKCFELVKQHTGRELTLANIPAEDPTVYDQICNADTVGVFQIESRAQMSMLPRLRPRCFYDLVIQVAIVRPGPIQGNMVHPYLRRRDGKEAITYPNEAVEKVLGRTLGVPLFQEQAMALAIVAGGFTPGEADQLRRAMAAWKRKGDLIFRFGEKLIAGMLRNGYARAFAERCFEQIKGFSEYGFPESHAASFALVVYVSSWLKCYYPAAFAAGLINSQPMGFYAPAQIVRDAKDHGVGVREVDVNASDWDCTLEGDGSTLRLGMRLVKGMNQTEADRIAAVRPGNGGYASIEDLWRRSGVRVAALRTLAKADAFGSLGVDRQRALWIIQTFDDAEAPLFDDSTEPADAGSAALPAIPAATRVRQDYAATGLSLKAHPVSFLRERLDSIGVVPGAALANEQDYPHGRRAAVAGLVLVRQRPGTASGIVFFTIEDESGIANLIVNPEVFERYRSVGKHSRFLCAHGRVERHGQVVQVRATKLVCLDALIDGLQSHSRDFH